MTDLYLLEFKCPRGALGNTVPNVGDPFDAESPAILKRIVGRMGDLGCSMQIPPEGESWGNCATKKIGNWKLTLSVWQLKEGETQNSFRIKARGYRSLSFLDKVMRRYRHVNLDQDVASFITILDVELVTLVKIAQGFVLQRRIGHEPIRRGQVLSLNEYEIPD